MKNLTGKKVAILATDGFEHSELFSPREALKEAGAQVDVVSLEDGVITSWKDKNWGDAIQVDAPVEDVSQEDYHGLVLPGGVINPDILRRDEDAVDFIRSFFDNHKPVAAICHAPQLLAEANVLEDRTITSFHSIKTDMVNAGAEWVDKEVVVDEGLVTSRNPNDLEAFNARVIEEIREGQHVGQTT